VSETCRVLINQVKQAASRWLFTYTIVFEVGDLEVTRLTLCKPKRTNWESDLEDQKCESRAVPKGIHSVRVVQLAVDTLQNVILTPKLSSQGGSLARDRSLVEQRVEPP